MPKHHLNALGDVEFECMVQSLLKRVIGAGTLTFGAGRDGAREATFSGTAPYPSETDRWSGNWIFQVKFHDTELVGVSKARAAIISDTARELENLTTKYKRQINNYILITNVPLSGVHERGTLDRLESEVFNAYRTKIPKLAVWGADDLNRFLDLYPEVRQPYLPLLITGDIIAELLAQVDKARSDRATTIDLYLRTAISREENAQLDQAGDVSEDAIPLQDVFFDLDAYIPAATQDALDRHRGHPETIRALPMSGKARVPMVHYLVGSTSPDRIVIVGGPGEGKSTIGQYLAQLHRATLLGNAEDIAISPEYVPETPRIPFRVVLKDFAQWLADDSSESSDSASLDSYLCEQVTRLSTREFTEKDLHEILKTDPALLVLDGLDEVTDAGVRRRLVSRLIEFLDRCQNGLHCDLRVVAATRPTNYNDQFDPKTFLHFRLHKLRDTQVKEYASKWAIARTLDEYKAGRLSKTINECLSDNQISLLMTTPLQVTILILIINSGGTPPRQREALFNEYLEVIYKREKAKGLDIVKTEKELLIGLHKFVGYLLHEEATKARTSSATLHRPVYDRVVTEYLRNYDPYSPDGHIQEEWKAITVDAGERLVLLVESPANVFGFELRSIQEFFAACYLSDTADDTLQRYERLAAIAHLPHWRNVTLFFAGRVGRSYPGEAANIVEVCKEMDRAGADYFVKRGAEVALELAAERALGPNRVLQRSLLEHGLTLFDSPISSRARTDEIELVRRLPYEDIRDHVLPIMAQRLPTLGHAAVSNACYLLYAVAPDSPVLKSSMLRLASEAGREYARDLLGMVAGGQVSSELRTDVIRALRQADVSPDEIGEVLGSSEWPVLCAISADLGQAGVDPALLRSFASTVALSAGYVGRPDQDEHRDTQIPEGNSALSLLLRCAKATGAVIAMRAPLRGSAIERAKIVRERLSLELPEEVILGEIEGSLGIEWFFWLTHLILGDVSRESWGRFVGWLAEHPLDSSQESMWSYSARNVSPIAGLVSLDDKASFNLDGLTDSAVAFAGVAGFGRWIHALQSLGQGLGQLKKSEVPRLVQYGLGVLDGEARGIARTTLDSFFDSRLQPIALEWLSENRLDRALSLDEFDRLAEWFHNLPSDSPWHRRNLAYRAAVRGADLGRLRAPSSQSFIDLLPGYQLDAVAALVAQKKRGLDEDLRFLLSQPQLADDEDAVDSYLLIEESAKRRRAILRLLRYVNDDDSRICRVACRLVTGLCLTVQHDEAPRSAIRSPELDSIQAELVTSSNLIERGAGIALYAVRPPRSDAEWSTLATLLRSATAEDALNFWTWAIPHSADLTRKPDKWIQTITSVLREGTDKQLALILTDVLRSLLPRESQSLVPFMGELGLPTLSVDAE